MSDPTFNEAWKQGRIAQIRKQERKKMWRLILLCWIIALPSGLIISGIALLIGQPKAHALIIGIAWVLIVGVFGTFQMVKICQRYQKRF